MTAHYGATPIETHFHRLYWTAVLEGFAKGQPTGRGATEQEAIADLCHKLDRIT